MLAGRSPKLSAPAAASCDGTQTEPDTRPRPRRASPVRPRRAPEAGHRAAAVLEIGRRSRLSRAELELEQGRPRRAPACLCSRWELERFGCACAPRMHAMHAPKKGTGHGT